MLSKEKIDNLLNILNLNNNYDIDSKNIIELLTAVKNENDSALLQTLFSIINIPIHLCLKKRSQ